jgi:cardiolipin synthase
MRAVVAELRGAWRDQVRVMTAITTEAPAARHAPQADAERRAEPLRRGNRVTLLENGEAFFPRVFDAIAHARHEVLLETFILFEDEVGRRLHDALIAAARRGVRVEVTVDGYGCPGLSDDFVAALVSAGVNLRVFDPCPRLLGLRTRVFRRMHRKIVVVDAARAFVGGINFGEDHLCERDPMSKQDYAVELEGPIVADLHAFVRSVIDEADGPSRPRRRTWDTQHARAPRIGPPPRAAQPSCGGSVSPPVEGAQVKLVVRDNERHRNDIEREYRDAIRSARREIVIANAYFFPGHRLLRDLKEAARRGVNVSLLVQGQPDMPIVTWAARLLYRYLVPAGVRIFEYLERPFHGKVALVDDHWATVGSSNLDPLSLSLNLEANVVVRDAAFNARLRERLHALIQRGARRIDPAAVPPPTLMRNLLGFLTFHFVRRFPAWAGLLPAHTPRMKLLEPPSPEKRGPIAWLRAHWQVLSRWLLVGFLIAVGALLFNYARGVDWRAVWGTLVAYEPWRLAAGAGLAAGAYLMYSSYDLLARRYVGHAVPARRVLGIAFVSYAFNLNLGALVGGAGFRYRLYTRYGVDAITITRILAFGIVSNWLGYVMLAGTLFALGAVPVPQGWAIGPAGMRALGGVLLLVAAGYFAACARFGGRALSVRGHEVHVPTLRLALGQAGVSIGHWLLIAGILYTLLPHQVAYPQALAALLLAAVAGAVTHIPAGLGVIEVVFLALLGNRIDHSTLIAALLAYRALFYLAPLCVALVVYLACEATARRSGDASRATA